MFELVPKLMILMVIAFLIFWIFTAVRIGKTVRGGFRRHRKLMDRAFDAADQELGASEQFVTCEFCGARVENATTCSQCGAPRQG